MGKRLVRSAAIAGGLGLFVLGAGASGCSCTIGGTLPIGSNEPPIAHPSQLRVDIGNAQGVARSEGGGDVYVQYDGASKSLAIWMVADYTVPALGPSCDFSAAHSSTKGGYTMLHVGGVTPGTTGKFSVTDAAILSCSGDGFPCVDYSDPLGSTTIEITKYDATAFEAIVSSPKNGRSQAEGKLVATKICPDLAGGDGGDATEGGAASSDTSGEPMDAGPVEKKHKKKKKSGG